MTKYNPKWKICNNIRRGINKGLTKYDLFENWCFHKGEKSMINSFYSYIQKEYWNVGFLKQYSFNTIDRIALAIPMNILSLYIFYKIYNYFNFSELIKEFNFGKFFMHNSIYESKALLNHNDIRHNEVVKNTYRNSITTNAFIIGGGLNYLVNFLILVFIAHPQINNRLLSGCPILYLFICEDVIDFIENNKKGNYKKGFAILLFFISFAILGCIMQVGAYGFA
jgi:Gpi18-like mannosyltransferase